MSAIATYDSAAGQASLEIGVAGLPVTVYGFSAADGGKYTLSERLSVTQVSVSELQENLFSVLNWRDQIRFLDLGEVSWHYGDGNALYRVRNRPGRIAVRLRFPAGDDDGEASPWAIDAERDKQSGVVVFQPRPELTLAPSDFARFLCCVYACIPEMGPAAGSRTLLYA